MGERMRCVARKPHNAARTALLSQSIASLSDQPGDVARWSVALPAGIHYSHPFQDRRVQRLGLGILQRISPVPTPAKPLLAMTMGNALPECIRHRRSKGHFDEMFYRGLSRHLPVLEGLLLRSKLNKMEVLDANRLKPMLEMATLGGRNCRQLQPLVLALCLECWLSNEQHWRQKQIHPDVCVVSTAVNHPMNSPRPLTHSKQGIR